MTLREKQSLFASYLTTLLVWLREHDYELSFDEAYRPPELAEQYCQHGKGSLHSLHCCKLAMDLNVFTDGKLLQTKADWLPIGNYWKSLDPECRWGGDFTGKTAGDFRHFSLAHEGRA